MSDLNIIQRMILRREAMGFLKKYWPTIGSVLGIIVPFLLPSINTYVQQYPHTSTGVLLTAVVAAYHATAPKHQ